MKTLAELVSEARSTHDIYNVLGLDSRKKVIVCPLPMHVHHHNTPSFSIFTARGMQWWRCHGSCNLEGDVVDLVGYLRVPGYDKRDPDKIRQAVNLLDDRYEVVIPQPEPEIKLAGNEWKLFLPPGPEVIEYAHRRGLNDDTIERFKIGQSGNCMTMPCFEEELLVGIKMRNIRACDREHRFFMFPGSHIGLFNYDKVEFEQGLVFIVKGEIPCMLMDQLGFLACAPTAGEGSGKSAIRRWNTALALLARIIVGDNDAPGRELAHKRATLFGADLYFPPDRYKDLDQWILAEGEAAVAELKRWQSDTITKWWQ